MRAEDEALLRGRRPFSADLPHDGLEVVFVRAQQAHGAIVDIAVGEALASPGVVAVHTADSLDLGSFAHFPQLDEARARHPLAQGRVRHVGEAVAVVVADTLAHAIDAAERVWVDIDELPVLVHPATAIAADPLYESTTSNIVHQVFDSSADHDPGVDGLEASIMVDLDVRNNRVASAPIETDGILASPGADGRLQIWCTSQGVHEIRDELARALGIDPGHIRVRSPAVGGGFGGRATLPVEFIVVARLAQLLNQPVRFIQTRWENLTSMPAGRDTHTSLRLGLDDDGSIVSLDVDLTADAGSTAHMSPMLMVSINRQATGMYRIPTLTWNGTAVLTNTTPVGAYRGAGQPEANHARERALDVAAHRLGIDPIDLRRRNLLTADELPHSAPGGALYDTGDPLRALEVAVEVVDVAHWRARQIEHRSKGAETAIGIGVACYAQTSGRGAPADTARVRVTEQGRAEIACGSASHGQGHLTTLGTLVAQKLGLSLEQIDFVDSDTDAVATALTTGGSRATQILGTVVSNATDDVLAAARDIAASLLEASADDIVVACGTSERPAGLTVAGVPARSVSWSEVAARGSNRCIESIRAESAAGEAHPYGAHASIVEVDLVTGEVSLLEHVAVDDCGVVLQPELVASQQHGGSIGGIGQALWENLGYDRNGTPQNVYFTTYGLPSAAEVPFIKARTITTPTQRNILGTKGIGENGCNGATAAAHNAVCDAVSHLGIEHIDLPLTPQKVWEAINR
ncbi:MAG: xanthine dehydrogenase family protein [Actinomycetia bacterium]|nr:xanthine dehydrogenase family protein [Actinomycetes bacterium]